MGYVSVKYFVLFVCILISQETYANNIEVMGSVGIAHINIEQSYRPSYSSLTSEDSGALGVLVTYKIYSDVVIGGGANYYYGINFLGADDRVHVWDTNILVGYSIDAGKHYKIIPMIGESYWKYKFKQGAFLNPGPEEELNYGGSNTVVKIILKFPSKKLIGFNFGYTYGKNGFGALQSINCGIRFLL